VASIRGVGVELRPYDQVRLPDADYLIATRAAVFLRRAVSGHGTHDVDLAAPLLAALADRGRRRRRTYRCIIAASILARHISSLGATRLGNI
jgi:hypothetical protein